MGFPEDSLNAHEELVLDLHPHWWFLVTSVSSVVLAILLGAWVLVQFDNKSAQGLTGVVVLAAAIFFIVRYVQWSNTHFVLTSDRLIYRSGAITRKGVEIPLERINTIFFKQGPLERILGLGDLEIESASKDGNQVFEDIRQPQKVQKEIYVQMEANENRKFDRVSQGINERGDVGAPAGPTHAQQIEDLARLRDQGLITEAEFQAKKQELLDRM